MADEEWSVRPCFGSVEMPGHVAAMNMCDGRLMVTLADGRVIDMTDWFAPEATKQ